MMEIDNMGKALGWSGEAKKKMARSGAIHMILHTR